MAKLRQTLRQMRVPGQHGQRPPALRTAAGYSSLWWTSLQTRMLMPQVLQMPLTARSGGGSADRCSIWTAVTKRQRLLGTLSPWSPMHRKSARQRAMCQAALQHLQLVHLHLVPVQHVMHMSQLAHGIRVQHSGGGAPAASRPKGQKQEQQQQQDPCQLLVTVLRRAALASGG